MNNEGRIDSYTMNLNRQSRLAARLFFFAMITFCGTGIIGTGTMRAADDQWQPIECVPGDRATETMFDVVRTCDDFEAEGHYCPVKDFKNSWK